MTKHDIELLYEYDRWANAKVIDAGSALTAEQFGRNLGGGFPCVRDGLLHIIAGEWVWLQFWKAETLSVEFVNDLELRRDLLFSADLFHTPGAVREKWAEVEREQVEFLKATSNEDLNRMLPHETIYIPLVQLMQHVANHSTYHRGQIALMMRQLEATPVSTDFHVFLVERDFKTQERSR
jgi:uncharacterized damage-inducible protein DinB